jgi:CRISPR/Cas system CMR subunit Cmr4 (Cas7 group RAMP superfamily)
MSASYTHVNVKISLKSQYHLGSGFGLGRIIDSLLKVDEEGVPLIPGTTVSGLVGQALFDLLRFQYLQSERAKLCEAQLPHRSEPRLPCAVLKSRGDFCLLCYFMGSRGDDGVINWGDFRCSDLTLLRPMLKSGNYSAPERRQYIKPYFSFRQNLRTRTVLEKHLFSREEGAPLDFEHTLTFKEPVSAGRAQYLAAALQLVRNVGARKTRGKGLCRLTGVFGGSLNKPIQELAAGL